ncbi:MAG: hypothetical protein R3F61_14150 [Myxococcota bacterium]
MTDAPPRLNVRADLEGFTCDLPGLPRGSNSGWVLVFVAVWWLAALGVFTAVTTIEPALLDRSMGPFEALAFCVGLMGWGPAWGVFDAWWAGRNPRPLAADDVGVTFGGRRHLYADLDDLRVVYGSLVLIKRGVHTDIRLGTSKDEEDWLAASLGSLFQRVHARDGEVPAAVRELVEDAG